MSPGKSLRSPAGLILLALVLLTVGHAFAQATFGTVGLKVVPTERGHLVVLGLVPDSPADNVGLEPGDLIVQVDDFALAGSDFEEVVGEYLWGAPGTEVRLIFMRPGEKGKRIVKIQRAHRRTDEAGESPPGVRLIVPPAKE